MRALHVNGIAAAGMKPVASGATLTAAKLRNDDALHLLRQFSAYSGRVLDYRTVNPYVFEPPVAPHIAADWADTRIDPDVIATAFNKIVTYADIVLVEGIGGWCVPLGDHLMLVDLVRRLELSVILVVGLRLGCINHALSTARLIEADGVDFGGWIASQVDPSYHTVKQTLSSLNARIGAPFLGSLPYMARFDVQQAADCLLLNALLRRRTGQK